MRPPFVSVEMLLDDAAESAIRAEWQALADVGFSSLARHTAQSNRPHITALVRSELAGLELGSLFACPALPVTLGSPLLFGGSDRRILVRSVVPTADLMRLHATIHDAVGAEDNAPLTEPDSWTPHVTLARRLRLTDLPGALPLLGEPVQGHVTALRLWDSGTRSVTHLGNFA